MGFTLRVWFSGLCQFITNSAVGDEQSRIQLCVVLPNATEGPVRHEASVARPERVAFPDGRYRIQYPEDPKAVVRRFEKPVRVEFLLQDDGTAPVTAPFFSFSNERMIDFKRLAGDYADENPEIVSPKIVAGMLAQISFDRGHSGIDEAAAVAGTWYMPDLLKDGKGDYDGIEVAEPRFLEIPYLDTAEMFVTDIETGEIDKYPLAPESGEFSEVLITNRCTTPTLCLEIRQAEGENRFQIVQLDEDFAYHYDLLHPNTRQALAQHARIVELAAAGEALLPVPERVLLEWWLSADFFGSLNSRFEPFRFCLKIEGEKDHRTWMVLWDSDRSKVELPIADWLAGLSEARRELLEQILDSVAKAVGTGAGCDCLPCSAESRFLDVPILTGAPVPGRVLAPPASPPAFVADFDPSTGRRVVRPVLATIPLVGTEVAKPAAPAEGGAGPEQGAVLKAKPGKVPIPRPRPVRNLPGSLRSNAR